MTSSTLNTLSLSISLSSNDFRLNQRYDYENLDLNIDTPKIRPLQAALIPVPELDLGQPASNLVAEVNACAIKRISFFYKTP